MKNLKILESCKMYYGNLLVFDSVRLVTFLLGYRQESPRFTVSHSFVPNSRRYH